MPKQDEQFYLVWSPQGPTPPRVTHESYGPAACAANDMARQHPGQDFYVLKALTHIVKTEVSVTRLKVDGSDPDMAIPF